MKYLSSLTTPHFFLTVAGILFLYEVLDYLNFGSSFKRWMNVLNTDIQASVMQAGTMSKLFNIARGCR